MILIFSGQKNFIKIITFILTYPLRCCLKKVFARKQNKRRFLDFQNKYLNKTKIYNSYTELKTADFTYDCLIAGSDQIWNFFDYSLKEANNLIHTYFLDFGGSNVKRISCASSFGKDNLNGNHIDEIKTLMQKFDFVKYIEREVAK